MEIKLPYSPQLAAFQEALTADIRIYSWIYSSEGELLFTNCKITFLAVAFKTTGCKDYALNYGRTHRHPLILSANLGAMWCAVFEYKDDVFYRLHVIGPVFSTASSTDDIRKTMDHFEIQLETKEFIIRELSALPSVSSMTFFHDCTLLHYFVTGDKITRSDIHYQTGEIKASEKIPSGEKATDRNRTYAVEKELLKMVRDGNLDYKEALKNATMISSGVRMTSGGDRLGQAKISCCSFVSLCTRAAIEGGLTPETAYTVGDNYIQAMYNCNTFSDLVSINHAMYEDFIIRVNKKKKDVSYSRQIQTVLDLIQYHCEEKLSLAELSSKVFYSEAYLSRKFHEETGENIHDYILKTRLKNAAFDLENSSLPIHEIAEKYRFSSSNHFSECFRKVYGILPNAYRKEKWH